MMRAALRLVLPLAAITALAAASACRDANRPSLPAHILRLSTDSAVVHVDSAFQLSVEVLDSVGRPLTGRPVAWFVFDTTVATVDSTGLLRGVSVGPTSVAAASESALVRVPVAVVVKLAGISTGWQRSCALSREGRPYCWGGELLPRLVTGAPPLASVTAGLLTCGLTDQGRAWCWGASGPLGDGGDTGSAVAVAVQGGLAFTGLSASEGQAFVCGLTAAGEAYCWGWRSPAQGAPIADVPLPRRVAAPLLFRALSTGEDFACGLTLQGETWCWGENAYGQLGSRPAPDASCGTMYDYCTLTPRLAAAVPPLAAIASAYLSVCGLTQSGEAYCWGDNRAGQLGDSASGSCNRYPAGGPCSEAPMKVSGGLRFASLTAGTFHVCGVTAGGEAWCWGDNATGELGNPAAGARSSSPVRAGGVLLFRSLSAGSGATCGVATDGVAYCFDAGGRAVRVPFQP